MPIFEYYCPPCDLLTELLTLYSKRPKTVICPKCKKRIKLKPSSPSGFDLNTPGTYWNDYKRKK